MNKSPIQHDKIDELYKELEGKSKCPYSNFIRSVNTFHSYITTDHLPPVKKAIQQMIDILFLKKAPDPSENVLNTVSDGLSKASKAKLHKHLYDVVYLQEELYPLIHTSLTENDSNAFDELKEDSMKLNLRDHDTRRMRGIKFTDRFGNRTEQVIHNWERAKISDPQYKHALNFAISHSQIYARQPMSFGMSFVGGIADAQKNMRSIIEHVPELFYKKYNRFPDVHEYRSIVEANIRKILIPLSSINLEHLTSLVRPKATNSEDGDEIMIYNDQLMLVHGAPDFNAFGINTTDFALDENELLEVGSGYLQERSERMKDVVAGSELMYKNYFEYYSAGSNVTTGCPALRARTKEGTRVVEQFCKDIMGLLDKIYFPHWDK